MEDIGCYATHSQFLEIGEDKLPYDYAKEIGSVGVHPMNGNIVGLDSPDRYCDINRNPSGDDLDDVPGYRAPSPYPQKGPVVNSFPVSSAPEESAASPKSTMWTYRVGLGAGIRTDPKQAFDSDHNETAYPIHGKQLKVDPNDLSSDDQPLPSGLRSNPNNLVRSRSNSPSSNASNQGDLVANNFYGGGHSNVPSLDQLGGHLHSACVDELPLPARCPFTAESSESEEEEANRPCFKHSHMSNNNNSNNRVDDTESQNFVDEGLRSPGHVSDSDSDAHAPESFQQRLSPINKQNNNNNSENNSEKDENPYSMYLSGSDIDSSKFSKEKQFFNLENADTISNDSVDV